jgi:hypothetical protein
MECIHVNSSFYEGFNICDNCGLETLELDNTNEYNNNNFSINLSSENYIALMDDIPTQLKNEIVENFESLVNYFIQNGLQILRGDKKKAIFAVFYFFYRQKNGLSCIAKDTLVKFNINKKNFGMGSKIIFDIYPSFRNITVTIGSYLPYMENIYERFSKRRFSTLELFTLKLLFKKLNVNRKFNNFQPHAVCVCVILKVVPISFKKNGFMKTVGISEVVVKKINVILDRELFLEKKNKRRYSL